MKCAAIIGAGLVGLASVSPAPRERAVPFEVGETLTYDVSWSSYITAGTAVATVTDKKPFNGSSAYTIVAEGRPTPLVAALYTLHYRIDTVLDASTLLPQRASVLVEEGRRTRTRTTTFDRKTEPIAQDPLSAVYALRAVELRTGDRLTMPIVDNDRTYTTQLAIGAPESVAAPIGSIEAWKVIVTAVDAKREAAGRNMAVWISTDARRLPVRLQAELPFGNFSLALRTVR